MARNSDAFDGVSVFVAVVEAGSFTAAAERLGHSVSFVSKAVTRLEGRIGVRLLNRSTRTLSQTDAAQDAHPMAKAVRAVARRILAARGAQAPEEGLGGSE